jgi:hypothetical protein
VDKISTSKQADMLNNLSTADTVFRHPVTGCLFKRNKLKYIGLIKLSTENVLCNNNNRSIYNILINNSQDEIV